MRQEEHVLPRGWLSDFLDRADLERSFGNLSGSTHFHAETMRGRIRSLQVRSSEAWEHFDKALFEAERAPESIPNLIREMILNLYCFEQKLLEGPVASDLKAPKLIIPHFPEEVVAEYPEVNFAIDLRRVGQGFLQLHLRNWEASSQIFQELIESHRKDPGVVAMYYLGLAASQHNLGQSDLAFRTLEDAEFCVQSGGSTINRLRAVGILYAFYLYLGKEAEASGWERFLERLPCPKMTQELFLKRGRILMKRCADQASLVLL